MSRLRAGESRVYPFRSERFYNSNSNWYFMVRGGDSEGPFTSRAAAQVALDKFITRRIEQNRVNLTLSAR